VTPWSTAAIGDVAEIVSGATPKTGDAAYWDGGVPWATPRDLSCLEGPTIALTERTLTSAGLASCAASLLPAGSVLLSSRAPIGHVAINTVPMATNQGFKSLVPHRGLLEAKYAYHWLRANTAYLESLGNGATFKELSKATLSRVSIPLPPMEEQLRIAAILDQADALRAKRRAVASQVAALCPALFGVAFGEVFGARTRWPMVRLNDALLQIDSGTSPVCLDRPAVEDEWSVLKLGAISSLIFQPGQNKALKPGTVPNPNHEVHAGDVLFSRKNTRELVGASVYVEEAPPHLLLPDLIFRLVPASDGPLAPVYLKAALSTRAGREALRGLSSGSAASMVNISKGRLGGLEVAAPARALQAAFANRMAEVRALQKSLSAQTRETDVLFASLQGRAFKGEL